MDGRQQRGQATRDAIVAAARELFGDLGYEGTSIEAVLDLAGVARGALYHHFGSKAELFDAVLDREIAAVAAEAQNAARAVPAGVESLRAGCAAWLQAALDPAVQRILLLDSPAVVGWKRWRQLDEQHTLGGVRAAIRKITARQEMSAEEVDVLAHMVQAAVGEAALLIAGAEDAEAALRAGLAALDTLLVRLFTPAANPNQEG